MRIFLIRHGESQQNSDDVLSGITDIQLTDLGEEQCRGLASVFTTIQIDKVVATPLIRSINSAKLIFPSKIDSIDIVQSLIEINYGIYEGYSRNNYSNKKDSLINLWLTHPSRVTFPEGDNVIKFSDNSIKSLTKLAIDNPDKVIACVLHRTIIRLLISKIIGLPIDKFREIPCDNCGISELTYLNSQWKLQSLNCRLTNKSKNQEGQYEF